MCSKLNEFDIFLKFLSHNREKGTKRGSQHLTAITHVIDSGAAPDEKGAPHSMTLTTYKN